MRPQCSACTGDNPGVCSQVPYSIPHLPQQAQHGTPEYCTIYRRSAAGFTAATITIMLYTDASIILKGNSASITDPFSVCHIQFHLYPHLRFVHTYR